MTRDLPSKFFVDSRYYNVLYVSNQCFCAIHDPGMTYRTHLHYDNITVSCPNRHDTWSPLIIHLPCWHTSYNNIQKLRLQNMCIHILVFLLFIMRFLSTCIPTMFFQATCLYFLSNPLHALTCMRSCFSIHMQPHVVSMPSIMYPTQPSHATLDIMTSLRILTLLMKTIDILSLVMISLSSQI